MIEKTDQKEKKYEENIKSFFKNSLVICYLAELILIIIWLFKLLHNTKMSLQIEFVILKKILQITMM